MFARFEPAVRLDVPPQIVERYLREDCGRIYFTAIGSVFYLAEQ